MQLCDVTLHHNGNLLTTIRKKNVTVAEIAVLQFLHGADAVTKIEPIRTINRRVELEVARLREVYDAKEAEDEHPVDKLWPGLDRSKPLPKTLADLGITRGSPFLGFAETPVPEQDAVNFHTMNDLPDDEMAALDGGDGMDDDDAEPAAEPAALAADVLKAAGKSAGKSASA